jgi:arylsulfatase A-like enzyme
MRMAPGWLRRWAEAWLFAGAALLVEVLGVAVVARNEFAAGYELTLALQTLVPLAMLGALPIALFGALFSISCERGDTARGRGGAALLMAAWLGAVAWACSAGRLLAGARRPAFVVVSIAAGAAVGWLVAPRVARALRALGSHRWAFFVPVGAVFGLLELANARVLPKLYPGFHLGLAVLALAVAGMGALSLERTTGATVRRARVFAASVFAVFALSLVAAVGAPRRLRFQDNARWIFLEHAPLLGYAVEISAIIEPPPPLDDEPVAADAPKAERALEFGDRDVLLVSIDALRADHVGAYGYDRPTTPRIDSLAREGAVFDAAYTATPHTSYAVASLMTGKYMRPLLLQGLGSDSETLAGALRRYDVRTAAFYPPAVFFVDRERFSNFEESAFGFEYRKEQFAPAAERAEQLRAYLGTRTKEDRLFVWVHLFEPHEPYVAHPEHAFGDRAVDRYDSEVAEADEGLGAIVDAMRSVRPNAIVVVTADHGEEFGDHGGRYHGTTVFDEQVRVPLIFHAPGLIAPSRNKTPVGLVDILPTLLNGAAIPISPRVRGRDLGPALVGRGGEGMAFSETDEHTMLARGSSRLICARKVGACRLFDIAQDPRETEDASASHGAEAAALKDEQRRFVASLGRFEAGADTSWPHALRRGLAGDVEAATDVASLLGDADVRIRRKAAETLFELGYAEGGAATAASRLGSEVTEPLRRALGSDEDEVVRRWAAVALTRLGQGAPLAFDLVRGTERDWQRVAALALAEGGDDRGLDILLAWWSAAFPADASTPEPLLFERAKQLVAAFAGLKSEATVGPLARGLADVRLRRFVAKALALIGKDTARPALAAALNAEPYQDARSVLARALVELGGRAELVAPLAHFLGVADPMPDGLELAEKADVLAWIGGPNADEIGRLRRFATSGVTIGVVVPEGGNGQGHRILVRARSKDGAVGEVRIGVNPGPRAIEDRTRDVPKSAPKLDAGRSVTLSVNGGTALEVYASLPKSVKLAAADAVDLVLYATQNVEVESLALVPMTDEGPVPKRKR